MSLLKAGLSGQTQSGQVSFLDTFPERFAKILLQGLKLHKQKSIAVRYSGKIFTVQ